MIMKSYNLLAIVVAIGASFYLIFADGETATTYQGIWLLPCAFVISATFMLSVKRHVDFFPLTYMFFYGLSFLRFVVTPLFIHFSGPSYVSLEYISVTQEGVSTAINLMAYELVFAACFFSFAAVKFGKPSTKQELSADSLNLSGSRLLYGVVAFFGFALLAVWGIRSGLLSFIVISGTDLLTEPTVIQRLAVQFIVAGAWLTFLLLASKSAQHYRFQKQLWPVFMSVIAGMLLVMLIFGDRRSVQLYTAVAVAATLVTCFPDRKKSILVAIAGAMSVTILSITVWRLFSRYGVSSGDVSLLGSLTIDGVATVLQSYVAGPYQIAAANHLLASDGVGFGNMLFDFARSTFIVNFFVDRGNLLSSQIMNDNIYRGQYQTGWLIFTTSYGYVMLGSVFAPAFLVLNLAIAMTTEFYARRARGLETRFLFTYLLTRVVSFPFNATPLLISFYSIQLFTVGLVIFVASLIKNLDKPFQKGPMPIPGSGRPKVMAPGERVPATESTT